MFKFYDIDEKYVKYLQTIDKQVPNIYYNTNNKFMCGVVIQVNNIDYYAPISHITKKQQTNLVIFDNNIPISSIRFSFMIPAYKDVLKEKDFAAVSKTDKLYADLLKKEYNYCLQHLDDIHRKAESVYKIGCNKSHKLNYTCCDFKKLEENYIFYLNVVRTLATSVVR